MNIVKYQLSCWLKNHVGGICNPDEDNQDFNIGDMRIVFMHEQPSQCRIKVTRFGKSTYYDFILREVRS